MAKRLSLLLLLASVWTTRLLAQGGVKMQELSILTPCRIMGIALLSRKGPQFNFTQAEEACEPLGMTLASKEQVEAARQSGFETCSYGWVREQFVVIPRIFANDKCGKNGTGVLIWKNPLSKPFRAYCHNSSDTWVNSCVPEVIPTFDPVPYTPASTPAAEVSVGNDTYSSPDAVTPARVTTRAPPSTSIARKTKLVCVTEVFTETPTVATETMVPFKGETTAKNEPAGFGGVPTTLLVLALLFFSAAAVLAVCYVKRYVKAFPFVNKSQQKEMIETKVVKEEKADEGNPTEEPKKADKNSAVPHSPPRTTVRCLEAEV